MAATEMASIVGGGVSDPGAEEPQGTEAPPEVQATEQGESGATPAQVKPTNEQPDIATREDAPKWAREAVTQERRKRQEYERQIAELQGKLSVYSQVHPKAQAPEQPIDEFDQFLEGPKYVKGEVEKGVGSVRSELESLRYQFSEDLTRNVHTDYDDTIAAFHEAAHDSPGLLARFQAQASVAQRSEGSRFNPAKFAYEYAKAFQEVGNVNSLAEYRERIEKELREKIETELRGSGAQTAASKVSPSTAGARGTGGKSTPVFAPTPLAQIARGTGV